MNLADELRTLDELEATLARLERMQREMDELRGRVGFLVDLQRAIVQLAR